jgi:hypothetical protein
MVVQGGWAFAACDLEPPKVWIHIQDARQMSLADAMNHRLGALMVDGAAVSPQPVQVVQDGPGVDEIRYFKVGDRKGALAIAQALKGIAAKLIYDELLCTRNFVV